MCIAITFPCRQLLPEQIHILNPAGQTLPCHYIQLYFGNVQPAPMFRCVMDFQPSGNPAGFRSRKCLVQGRNGMRVQVVHDKYDLITVRITDIHKIPDLISPVNCCTVCTHAYMAYAAQRLYECKNAAGVVPDIFRIDFSGISRTHGQRLPDFPEQLIWFFIHAYHGNCRMIGRFINIQDILHAGYEFHIFSGRDAPVGIFVRSKFIFFSARRIASFPIGTSSSTRAFSSNSLKVQRECPSGTRPQAIWMMHASLRPSSLRRAALELGLML